MNYLSWFVTLARTAALALGLAGRPGLGRTFTALASAAEAGADVEAHMAGVKAKLEAGPIDDADWEAVTTGIESGSARLQGG